MAGGRLFEQGVSVTPDLTYRLASGKSGVATQNHTWQTVVDFLKVQLLTGITGGLTTNVIAIGVWNMDTTPGVNVPWALPASSEIAFMSAVIYSDIGNVAYKINHIDGLPTTTSVAGSIEVYNPTLGRFELSRTNLGFFDNPNFTTLANRGFVQVQYKAI